MRPDTPEAVAERIYYRRVVKPTVEREFADRYPTFPEGFTREQVMEAIDWQTRRLQELAAQWNT
jgi:hypothetical protein